jgi:MFS transporter, DHA2 family, multidrug resistance protein
VCGSHELNLSAYDQLCGRQAVRALGMPLVMVPITTVATGLIEPDHACSASALFNIFRNLGGSTGIAHLRELRPSDFEGNLIQ